MQTSSTSRTCSSSGRRNIFSRAGFTLVELLISIAIIGVVTSIVLVKYGTFDSTVLLKSLAYEIALTLREAQVRSVSVAGEAGEFDFPYGVTFSVNSSKQYTTFRYENLENDPTADAYYPRYDANFAAADIRVFSISRTMQVADLCVTNASGVENCDDVDRLDVSFRRPKFKGIFWAEGYSTNNVAAMETIQSAKIKVQGEGGINVFVVEVTNLGQISVYKE